MKAQRAHLTGSMRVYGKVAEHNSETLSSEDYSNIFTSFVLMWNSVFLKLTERM